MGADWRDRTVNADMAVLQTAVGERNVIVNLDASLSSVGTWT